VLPLSLAHPSLPLSRKSAFFIVVLSGLLLLLLAVLSLLVPAAHAGEVTVAWDPNPEPEVAGYKIYYGTSPGSYTSSIDVGRATSAVISGLQDGVTYFFSAVAYDDSNNESGFSNEIAYAVSATASAGVEPSSGGGACFIATAAFGSYQAPEVILLRKFRDRFLLTNAPGTLFVEFYYRVSPSIADFISHYDSLRRATRLALKPLVFSIQHRQALYMVVLTLLLAMTFIAVFEQRRIMREVRRIGRY
jgi:hypothetical protein